MAPGGGEHPDLLLRPADEHHPLGAARGQERGQLLAHHVVLALPRGEFHQRDPMPGGECLDLGVERLRPGREHRRGRDRLAQVLPDEARHAQLALQLRDVQVAVDAVDALQLEHHMARQDIGSRTG